MLFNYLFEARLSSRHKWSHMKLHKHEYWSHFVWGPISIVYGQPHLEPITVCAHCYEAITRLGEDSLDWCEPCQSIEGETIEITTEEYESV